MLSYINRAVFVERAWSGWREPLGHMDVDSMTHVTVQYEYLHYRTSGTPGIINNLQHLMLLYRRPSEGITYDWDR